MSEGRDIGVVFNLPRRHGPCVLPVCGGVGTQYTPAVGWAQALRYRQDTLGDPRCEGSIAVAHGGDASTATNGFWAALNIATTERLPLLFFIEDNGYGISVPDAAANAGRQHRAQPERRSADCGCSTATAPIPCRRPALIRDAVERGARRATGRRCLRLTVPRLSGHSGQDTQTYKGAAAIAAEQERDPWRQLRAQLVPAACSRPRIGTAEVAQRRARWSPRRERRVEQRSAPDPERVQALPVLGARRRRLRRDCRLQGGIWPDGSGAARAGRSVRRAKGRASTSSPRYAARSSTSSR